MNIDFISDILENHKPTAHTITLLSGFLIKLLYDALKDYFSKIKRHNDEGKKILRILLENNFDTVTVDFIKAINAIDMIFTNDNETDSAVISAKIEYMWHLDMPRNSKNWQINRKKCFKKLIEKISLASEIKNNISYTQSYSPSDEK